MIKHFVNANVYEKYPAYVNVYDPFPHAHGYVSAPYFHFLHDNAYGDYHRVYVYAHVQSFHAYGHVNDIPKELILLLQS